MGNPQARPDPITATDDDIEAQERLRRQLTLFIPPPDGPALDRLRTGLDPVQAGLIAAHITLCREDELAGLDWPVLRARLMTWPGGALRLSFGRAERFHGHGLLLPCLHGQTVFQALRCWVLQDDAARPHTAHLTLAHPRNPRAPGNTEAAEAALPTDWHLMLHTACLIEQQGGQAWRHLHEARFDGGPAD
jgi:hypothetical protein